MPERFPVKVDADQFDRLARPTQPLAGVAELIWNALDAEANAVSVGIERSELEAVEYVTVTDDGHGMSPEEARSGFALLGGSWKKQQSQTKSGSRTLHGKEGAGRFRAFAVGRTVEWISLATNSSGELERTVIKGSLEDSRFAVEASEVVQNGELGTTVRISNPRSHAGKLLGDGAVLWLVTRFAVYLLKYAGVTVTYDGNRLDPMSVAERTTTIEIEKRLGGRYGAPSLQVFEWKTEAKSISPSLVLCDENGVALHELTDGLESPSDIRYTAYLTWPGFAEHANEMELIGMGNEVLDPVVDAAREAIKTYLGTRRNERRSELIDQWKSEDVYPYSGEATNAVEVQERKVFDVVAAAASSAVPTDKRSAKLSLNLIKEAIGQPPDALHRVLTKVFDLTPEQLADFDKLLERTNLASIIHTGKLVTDRLDFLEELEAMLFDRGKKEKLLERKELHRILANGRTWIFGEEYALAVDDKGLTKVLEAHRSLLGEPESDDGPVLDAEGNTRIVDLMLSRADQQADRRRHLVVELKRPSVKLTQKELSQITNYAIAVARDERFANPHVTWDFWLLGDSMDESVESLSNKKGQPPGLYHENDNYKIWVFRWSQVLEENRQRMHFYRDHLDYVPSDEESELDAVVDKYLAPVSAS